jgi:hypothetical protein
MALTIEMFGQLGAGQGFLRSSALAAAGILGGKQVAVLMGPSIVRYYLTAEQLIMS